VKTSFVFACALLACAFARADEPDALKPTFRAPKGWEEGKPRPIITASFHIKDGERKAEVVIVTAGGSLAANVNRWRGQLGLKTLSDEDARASLKPLKVGGRDAHAFDALGPDEPDKEAQRIRVVIVPAGEQLWFFRLSGPASLVKREGKAFDEFIDSVRFAK
jgi:hypothetical protein